MTLASFPQFAGGDCQVDQIVVDDDRRQPAWAAACPRLLSNSRSSISTSPWTRLIPACATWRARSLSPAERIGFGQLPFFAAVGVGMVGIGEGDSSVGGRPAPEGEVAAGDEDQVAFQFARPASTSPRR